MTINQLNLVIGVLVGLALGILLRAGTPTDREDNVHVMRRPIQKAG